jgi:hypothetical protein
MRSLRPRSIYARVRLRYIARRSVRDAALRCVKRGWGDWDGAVEMQAARHLLEDWPLGDAAPSADGARQTVRALACWFYAKAGEQGMNIRTVDEVIELPVSLRDSVLLAKGVIDARTMVGLADQRLAVSVALRLDADRVAELSATLDSCAAAIADPAERDRVIERLFMTEDGPGFLGETSGI